MPGRAPQGDLLVTIESIVVTAARCWVQADTERDAPSWIWWPRCMTGFGPPWPGGHFPLVHGADCAVLLTAVPALADVAGSAGLVFIDGHEDATLMEASATGEAANMEVAFLLGLTGQQAPEPLRSRVGVLRPEAMVMLGMRDDQYRAEIGVPSIAGRVRLLTADDVHPDPAHAGTQAAEQVASRAAGW
jgi:arginase